MLSERIFREGRSQDPVDEQSERYPQNARQADPDRKGKGDAPVSYTHLDVYKRQMQ